MPQKKLPPYCSLVGECILLRKLQKVAGTSSTETRDPLFLWRSPDQSDASYKLAWKVYTLTEELEHYGKYGKINLKYYNPKTLQHLKNTFMRKFADNQQATVGQYHQKSIREQTQALQRHHLESIPSCCDTQKVVRDLDAEKFLKARKHSIEEKIKEIRKLQQYRHEICTRLCHERHGHFEFTGFLQYDVHEPEKRINSLLQSDPKKRKIYLNRRGFKVDQVLQICDCGPNYRVPGMADQKQLKAKKTIPAYTILGLYNYSPLTKEDFEELHLHPIVFKKHSAYALHLSLKRVDDDDWPKVHV